jgi:Na+-transporting methylmalonyl-CoA/oxaloacetate decarboxylase gamma subunit
MESQLSAVEQAVIYSFIAFSIVFIILGGLTAVIYAMRVATGSSAPSGPSPASSAAQPQSQPQPKPQLNVKAQHVAAITAAILASTQGKGRIVNVAPVSRQRTFSSETTRLWSTVAVVEANQRRLAPSWKQQTSH